MLLLFLASIVGPAGAKLVALDRRIEAAMVANDRSVLRRSIAPDFRFTHADGSVETKEDVLRSAALKPAYYLRRDVITAAAELHGSFALVFGTLEVASGATAEDPSGTRAVCYTLNYVHAFGMRHGRWRLLSHRTTEMTKPVRPCTPAS
jgi:hypothetical protein